MTLKKTIRKALQPAKSWLFSDARALAIDNKLLLGKMASWQVRAIQTVNFLHDIEFKVSSQWGEDGIIDWLVERLNLPPHLHSFIEFGVEDYRESNTRFLLQNRNWRGLVMDGNPNLEIITTSDNLRWGYGLKAKSAFITKENINTLIREAGFVGEIGLLNIDLDGNDYWIWQAIDVVRPVICVCEYNAIFGDLQPISVPYDPAFYRTNAHFSNLYFGASIAALCSLAKTKGYRFVGTTSAANDAFFVREDYAERFLNNAIKNIYPSASKVQESKHPSGELSFLEGLDRLKRIEDMNVVNVETGEIMPISAFPKIYSDDWLKAMSVPEPNQ